MTPPSERAVAEALAALQRLHHHGIVPLDEAREAARLLARDPSLEFPPPAPAGQEPAPGETGEAQTSS